MRTTIKIIDDNDDVVEISVPAVWAICDGCHGNGTHVHRAIDGDGLTPNDMTDDPDFADEYFSGTYDVQCTDCRGTGKTMVPNLSEMTPAQLRQWEDYNDAEYCEQLEREYERKWGC